ncbi:chaplin [Streptomyces sp. NPDC088725]|uniref:chaplin n=1 Tax=Streptomyces sp. NPDC088725 TaxID=3365873 RepID=UPI003829433F
MSRIAKAAAVLVSAGAVLAGGAGMAAADAGASGAAVGSPGVISGNAIQVPVHIPVNLCGNTIDVVGVLNPAFGNQCANISGGLAEREAHHEVHEGHQGGYGG